MNTHRTSPGAGRPWGHGLTLPILFLTAIVWAVPAPPLSAAPPPKANKKGNVLIADQFNNRVIEVDPATGAVVATFGDGSSVAGATSFVAPNDAERVGPQTLISCTGAPPASESSCPNGCNDSRVVLVNPRGHILWQYGQAGIPGSGDGQLNTPVQATFMPNGHILITDQGNHRVIEVTKKGKIVWQQGETGVAGSGFNQLDDPNSAEYLSNGHFLIADEGNNRVIEVDAAWNVVWKADVLVDSDPLNAPAFASRLDNGNTLISDGGNNRIVEVDPSGNVVWSYTTNLRSGSVVDPYPSRAVRLKDGTTLISDQFNHQVIKVDASGSVVWSYGTLAESGRTTGLLNAPYDAKVIGDYTGLTKPPKPSSNGGGGGMGGGGGYGY